MDNENKTFVILNKSNKMYIAEKGYSTQKKYAKQFTGEEVEKKMNLLDPTRRYHAVESAEVAE